MDGKDGGRWASLCEPVVDVADAVPINESHEGMGFGGLGSLSTSGIPCCGFKVPERGSWPDPVVTSRTNTPTI